MKKISSFALFFLGIFLSGFVFADTPDVSIASTVIDAMQAAATLNLLPMALTWLGSFMALQFVLTQIGLLKSGADIEAVIGKLIGSLLWFGFCLLVINKGPDFIDSVGTGILNQFAPNLPGPGSIITATIGLCTAILGAILFVGAPIIGVIPLGNVLGVVLFVVFSVGMYMAIKVFMITMELGLIVMLSPLSFSFLGINALKDQGIAPFKALISLAYRIILMGIIYSAFGQVTSVATTNLHNIHWLMPSNWPQGMVAIFSALSAFPMIAFLLYKSDSIAATLAGGGSSMSGGDVAGAAAAGAAAGAMAGSGGSAVGKAPMAMSTVISEMMGGGAIKNATQGMGTGGMATPVGTPPVRPPSPSIGPTTRNGAPIRPTEANSSAASAGTKSPAASSSPGSTGSGQNAGIGGAGNKVEENLGKLVDHLANQTGGKKNFGDHLSNVNQHVAQEKAATHVSINTNSE